MRFLGLACDYDGTIAHHGVVDEGTIATLERLRASGRKLLLVTGRELDDLLSVFPRIDLFDRVVAENGALLYQPATKEEKPLGEPPPKEFIDRLRSAGVAPVSVGHVIVATWQPHETTVLTLIRELGLELQVIFNKGAVMVLPTGVNKASGLSVALDELALSPHNMVAVGDAENDHAFLKICECSVAVANALPALKQRADIVTEQPHGAGVAELIEKLIANDLREFEPALSRHNVLLGHDENGGEIRVKPYGGNILVAGPSGTGKSTAAIGLLERLAECGYQFCLMDPEGDYEELAGAVVLGDSQRPASVNEILQLLRKPSQNALVKLYGLPLADRPAFFASLLPQIEELRRATGRPHWLMVDEAHHLLPRTSDPAYSRVLQALTGMLLVTVHPESVAPAALASVGVVIAIGEDPRRTFRGFGKALGVDVPAVEEHLSPGEALVWFRSSGAAPQRIKPEMASIERRRHRRKYAEGELPPDRSFYFRGPEGKLNLRAQNLIVFMQMADGVDDETWMHHLRRGDYSRWLREAVKDSWIADQIESIEQQPDESAAESRAAIRKVIDDRYTAAA
ncbi:MAG TPA: HAD-IIB family hydrolase [Bryobacteraceae bacterium]|nr:HAD-IIB family hydrolase [Bryobacteraceae bacterium]